MSDDAISGGQRTEDGERIEDSELLRRYAEESSEQAFAEFVRRTINLVYGAALRRTGGGQHRANDVTQEVFIAAARNACALARHERLTGWLYTATRNAAFNLMRDEQRRRKREGEAHDAEELSTVPAAEAAPNWEQLRPVLDAAMDELNERDREALLVRFFEGQALADVGTRLRVTENTARMRVERALEKLRGLLARRGVTSTSAALTTALANQVGATAPAGLAASVTGAALSSAGVGATSALTLLQFMSTTKFAVGITAIVGILALGTASYSVHARSLAAASLVIARQDAEATAGRLRGFEQRAQAAELDAAKLKVRVEAARAAVTAAAAPDAKAADTWDPVAEGRAFYRRYPELLQVTKEWSHAGVNFRYGSLFSSLGLTPRQIEECRVLLTNSTHWKVWGTIEGKTVIYPNETDLPRAVVDARLRALLGEEGYRTMIAEHPIRDARELAARLATALCFSETPLTVEQSDRFVQIAAATRTSGAEVESASSANAAMFDWDSLTNYARGILSPTQLRALANLRALELLSRTTKITPSP